MCGGNKKYAKCVLGGNRNNNAGRRSKILPNQTTNNQLSINYRITNFDQFVCAEDIGIDPKFAFCVLCFHEKKPSVRLLVVRARANQGCFVNTWLLKGGVVGIWMTLNSCFVAR
jgi:hypothetical protein